MKPLTNRLSWQTTPARRWLFPGDIGTSPPGIDNIVDSGIRMPEVGETASDRKKREEAEERKRKLKVSQLN